MASESGTQFECHAQLAQLFDACDLDGSGYIEERELFDICTELTPGEIRDVFRQLDHDNDGYISKADFSAGFSDMRENFARKIEARRRLASSNEEDTKSGIDNTNELLDESTEGDSNEFLQNLDKDLQSLSCNEQVCELHQLLREKTSEPVLGEFEDIILSVINDVSRQRQENARLQQTFVRTKEEHLLELRRMEEDMEHQIQSVENRVKAEHEEKLLAEKSQITKQLEQDIVDLQSMIEQQSRLVNQPEDVKLKLDVLDEENRFLKSNLTDSQTKLAMMRAEVALLRQQYKDKCCELEANKVALGDYVQEQENLLGQVRILHGANITLQDVNDELREVVQERCSPMLNIEEELRSGRVLSRHSSISTGEKTTREYQSYIRSTAPLAAELGSEQTHRVRSRLIQDKYEVDSGMEEFDSGHSTARDLLDSSEAEITASDDVYTRRREVDLERTESLPSETRFNPFLRGSVTESLMTPPCDLTDTLEAELEAARPSSTAPSYSSQGSSHSARRTVSRGSFHRQLPSVPQQQLISKEPENVFKVVLCGDAAVGKSSFILRLCKGHFYDRLTSTLGIDFHTKTIEVDGGLVSLQLWDTAGQERFRSVSRSYFRKADGVLLMYDCSYERSFINVRGWVETIKESAQKLLPIMFVATKTDLRRELVKSGRTVVDVKHGQDLAKEYGGLFIETSSKEDVNILEAVIELARLLRNVQDLEVKSIGLKVQNINLQHESRSVNCCT